MKHQYLLKLIFLVLAIAFGNAPVLAKDDCEVPIQLWQSRDVALQSAIQRGWHVERLKIDDGCYEIRGIDADGYSFKAKLDPQTLQIVKYKRRKPDRKRDH